MQEECRVCAAELRGNQRRWLFSSRAAAAADLRAVLSHVLGRRVSRDGRGEFLCGKCAGALERLYRFDAVIARVQALSVDKVRRLLADRDALGRCLRHLYARRQPAPGGWTPPAPGLAPSGPYLSLLQGDLALSAYECWSEPGSGDPGPCPNRGCFSCRALRVPDANYESVCKVPRRLARALAGGDLHRLSRDKSRSMPLDWLRAPERRGSGSSSNSSSVPSLDAEPSRPGSRSLSVSSFGAVPGSEPEAEDRAFDDAPAPDRSLAALARWISGIVYRPVHTLPSSKIPIRVGSGTTPALSGPATPRRQLSFHGDAEPVQDWMCDFSSEYLPFNLEKFLKHEYTPDGLRQRVVQLGEQLEVATSRIRGLEARLKDTVTKEQEPSLQSKGTTGLAARSYGTLCRDTMVQRLASELHSKEQLLQECVELVKQLTGGTKSRAEVEVNMIEKLRQRLKERDEALERSADENFAALEEKEGEVQRLHLALREKDRDLSCLGEVLVRNKEMINMLNHTLKQKDALLGQLEMLCQSVKQACGQRDEKRVSALREKDNIIAELQAVLRKSTKDVEALSDSLLSQGLVDGSDTSVGLCHQLREKEQLLSEVLADRTRQCAEHEKVTQELLKHVGDKDKVIKEMSDRHLEKLAVQAEELLAVSQQLEARNKELDKWSKLESTECQDHFTELAHLRALLDDKDRMILNLLEDGRAKDRVLSSLQVQLRDGTLLKVNMSQTL